MNLVTKNGLPLLQFPQLEKFEGLVHAVTTRQGGTSKGPFASLNLGLKTGDVSDQVLHNRRRVLAALGWNTESVATPTQVHGNRVVTITQPLKSKEAGDLKSSLRGVDGVVTKEEDLMLMITVADCFPVFLYRPAERAIGLMHVGWRGAASGIITRGIEAMVESFGCEPENIQAGIGPGIGKCCYTVGKDVWETFRKHEVNPGVWLTDKDKKLHLDLKETIAVALIKGGLSKYAIGIANECTYCNEALFFSHRRDKGKTGRMAALIGLKG